MEKKRQPRKRKGFSRMFISFCLAFLLGFSAVAPPSAYAEDRLSYQGFGTDAVLDVVGSALDWSEESMRMEPSESLLGNADFLEAAGSSLNDWFAFTLGRLGDEDGAQDYLAALEDYVTDCYATEMKLDSQNATEWHRIGLTVLALGGDPASFGVDAEGRPVNLVADGTYYRGKTAPIDKQGTNGYIYALLLLDASGYVVPDDAVDTRESIIAGILRAQREDGGFALGGSGGSSVDATAMAIQALSPYYGSEVPYGYIGPEGAEQEKTIEETVDEALAYLSEKQAADGTFGSASEGGDSESCSQVIVALCSLGINPSEDARFSKGGFSVVDGLMSFNNEDGGFAHIHETESSAAFFADGASNLYATEQAIFALTSLARHLEGMDTVFDLRHSDEEPLFRSISVSEDQTGPDGQTTAAPGGEEGSGSILVLAVAAAFIVFVLTILLIVRRRSTRIL